MKYYFVILAIALAGAATPARASEKTILPKVAIYIISDTLNDKQKMVMEGVFASFLGGRYTVVARNEDIYKALNAESTLTENGVIDSDSIDSKTGKLSDAKYMCVVQVIYTFNKFNFIVSLVANETGISPITATEYTKSIEDREEVDRVIEKVFKKISSEPKEVVKPVEKSVAKPVEIKKDDVSSNPSYFTTGTRWGTFATNAIFPGVGSILFMDDFSGAMLQWPLFGSGLAFYFNEFYYVGIPLLALNVFSNAYRSWTYNEAPRELSAGDRTISFFLNLTLPGSGYIFTGMGKYGDASGFGFAAVSGWIGYAGMFFSILDNTTGEKYLPIPNNLPILVGYGILSSIHIVASTYHAITYKDKEYKKKADSGGRFNFAVLPDSHGKLMPYLMYNKFF